MGHRKKHSYINNYAPKNIIDKTNGGLDLDDRIIDLKYADNYFDFVLCQNVIHHTADELKTLKEIYRVLRPGGKAYVNVLGKGGIITRFFMELLRDEYQNNAFLHNIVDKKFSEELKIRLLEFTGLSSRTK